MVISGILQKLKYNIYIVFNDEYYDSVQWKFSTPNKILNKTRANLFKNN